MTNKKSPNNKSRSVVQLAPSPREEDPFDRESEHARKSQAILAAAARAFYERVGFEQVAATPHYYQGAETALHMVKELAAPAP